VRTVIFVRIDRLPQIVWPVLILHAVMLLRIISSPREVMIEQARSNFVTDDRFDGRHPDINFAARMMGCINYRFRGNQAEKLAVPAALYGAGDF
jgi:hypothetical protein